MSYTNLEKKEYDSHDLDFSLVNSMNKCLYSTLIVLFIAVILTIFSLVYISKTSDNLNDRKPTIVDKIIKQIMGVTLDFALPTRFMVDKSYLIPPTNQMSRGTCWIFSTTMLLESHYRHQGIKAGYLNSSEYVSFSKQAYGAFIGQNCIESGYSVKPCRHGGLPNNSTDDHKADSIYYFAKGFPELYKSILPESVCEYYPEPNPKSDFECPGMNEAIKRNPIEFKIKSFETASDVFHARKLMVKNQRPLTIGAPLPKILYYAPCDNSGWSKYPQCTDNPVDCPKGYSSTKCAVLSLPGRAPDGTFILVDDYTRTASWGGHAMNVVGYNDDWIYRSRHVTDKSLANLKGGFVLHNSWRSPGHSVEYLMGRRSEENEAVICPNHNLSSNWIPATLDCMIKNKGDHTQCGKSFKLVRGQSVAKHTDLLICQNPTYCDPKKHYVLAQSNGTSKSDIDTTPLFNGLDRVRFITWTNENDIKTEFFDLYPFHYLHSIFRPDDKTFISNHQDMCGYYMMPYDSLNMMNKKTWSNLDNFHVADINFEFTPSSYINGPNSNKFDLTYLKKSTKQFTELPLNGPLPYNYVY